MARLLLWTFERPLLTVVVVAVLTALAAVHIPKLEMDPSAEGLMVANDPARVLYEQVKRRFGSDNLTIVVVKADDVFTPTVLRAVQRLTEGLERLDGVTRVESLTTVRNIRGDGDRLDTEPLVGSPVPDDPATIARIRGDAIGNRVFVGNIVSADARATAITVYTDSRPRDGAFNERFTESVEALIRQVSAPGLTIYQIGEILTRVTNHRYIDHDERTVVPIGVAVLLLVLFLAFRTLQGVVIPTATALLSIVWTLGAMAYLGVPMNLLTSIVPSLLIAIGFTEDVHMLVAYHASLQHGRPKLDAIRVMLEESALPLTITSATTVAGFGTLIFTDVTMLVQFGVASSLGLTANFLVTMLVVPLMLRYWPVPHIWRSALVDGAREDPLLRFLDGLGRFNLKHRRAILIAAGLVAAGSLVGWLSLRVDTDLLTLLPKGSIVRQRVADLGRALGGALNFYVVVDTGRPDGVKDPQVLRKIAGLQDFLAGTGKVSKTVSVTDYIRKMHREMHGGDPAFEVIPDSADLIAQYMLLLEGRDFAKFVDFDASGANIVVRHNLTGSNAISALRHEIEDYIVREFPPTLMARPTGEAILTNNAVDFLAVNELQSLVSTFLVIALIHAALFMSFTVGLLSMIPNVIPVLSVYGLMGLTGIPLNISTALVATIAIGIAVDDTVHHMITYNRQLQEHHDQERAMFNTLRAQGPPIIYVSLALVASFLVLLFASLVSSAQFGLLSAFVMAMALIGELTLTPVLMGTMRLVTLWDMLLLKMNVEAIRHAPLFEGLSRWEARKIVLLGKLEAVAAGNLVLRKGETGDEMYMVITGCLRVFDRRPDGRETVLAELTPGAVFGEMALVTREVRSASVMAATNAEVLRLDFAALERIRRRFPYTGAKLFRNLARVLADRLRRTTGALVGDEAPVAGAEVRASPGTA
jgi:predicted RND superfamily exporter protein